MAKRLHIGGLPYDLTDDELNSLFSQIGKVESAKVQIDPNSLKSKGFGFVEMKDDADVEKAIDLLDGGELEGRTLTVSIAKEKEHFGFGGGRGFRGRGPRRGRGGRPGKPGREGRGGGGRGPGRGADRNRDNRGGPRDSRNAKPAS